MSAIKGGCWEFLQISKFPVSYIPYITLILTDCPHFIYSKIILYSHPLTLLPPQPLTHFAK